MKKIVLLGLLALIVVIFFQFDLEQYLTLDYVKSQQQIIDQYYVENRILTLIGFFVLYVVITGASLPGATVLTLAGGAILHDRGIDCLPGVTLSFQGRGAVAIWFIIEVNQ
jgi:uncharacterized membrane protein YdjX (TVP38/TMEM64 family)